MTKEEIERELKKRSALKTAGKCPVCESDVSKYGAEMFKDDNSRAQFKLSGCCQPCQDILFGENFRSGPTTANNTGGGMEFEYLAEFKDCARNDPPPFEETFRNVAAGGALFGINKNKARTVYSKITKSVLVKLGHMALTIIAHPVTIVAYAIYAVIHSEWINILLYLIVLVILTVIEDYAVRRIILKHAIADAELYRQLYRKGVINIKKDA